MTFKKCPLCNEGISIDPCYQHHLKSEITIPREFCTLCGGHGFVRTDLACICSRPAFYITKEGFWTCARNVCLVQFKAEHAAYLRSL